MREISILYIKCIMLRTYSLFICSLAATRGRGGYFTKNLFFSSLRFLYKWGSKRSKINEKRGSIESKIKEKIYTKCLKTIK